MLQDFSLVTYFEPRFDDETVESAGEHVDLRVLWRMALRFESCQACVLYGNGVPSAESPPESSNVAGQ